jgi:hypothetical protein
MTRGTTTLGEKQKYRMTINCSVNMLRICIKLHYNKLQLLYTECNNLQASKWIKQNYELQKIVLTVTE